MLNCISLATDMPKVVKKWPAGVALCEPPHQYLYVCTLRTWFTKTTSKQKKSVRFYSRCHGRFIERISKDLMVINILYFASHPHRSAVTHRSQDYMVKLFEERRKKEEVIKENFGVFCQKKKKKDKTRWTFVFSLMPKIKKRKKQAEFLFFLFCPKSKKQKNNLFLVSDRVNCNKKPTC